MHVSGSYLGIKTLGRWGFPLITLNLSLAPPAQCSHSNLLSSIFDTPEKIEKTKNNAQTLPVSGIS